MSELEEQLKAKSKWINKMLDALEYLAKEYEQIHGEGSLPGFVDVALNYDEHEGRICLEEIGE